MTSFIILATFQCAAAAQISVMETSEPVWDVAVEDLNVNGSGDILAVCCDPKTSPLKKGLAVFMNDGGGLYPSTPSFVLPLDPSISTLFWAEVDGTVPRELVAANAFGAKIYAFRGENFELFGETEFPSLLPSGVKEPHFLKNMSHDLDGDGIDEWLVPANGGYIIRNAEEQRCMVPCDVVSEIRESNSVQIMHQLPAHHVFSLEGHALKGLAFLSDEFADFAYGPDWSEHKRYQIPVNVEEKWEASAQMKDINGNELPDLIVTQTKGGVNMSVVTHIYIASAPFTYPDKPTAIFSVEGAVASPFLIDVDGDEKLDVMFIKVPFGIKTFINLFLRKKVTVEVDVFLFKDNTYGAKPEYSTKVTIDAPEERENPAHTMADFNGDGRIDVLFGSGSDEVVIHTGDPHKFISNKPWVTLPFVPFGNARSYDLNGNDAKDLVLFHPSGKNATKIEVAVF